MLITEYTTSKITNNKNGIIECINCKLTKHSSKEK